MFAPALRAVGTSWTLRDALLDAAGCDRKAGTLAYWEWREIQSALQAARERLDAHTGAPPGMDAERWANQPDRTLEEVLAALDAVAAEQDVPLLQEVRKRPWCDPGTIATCRVPFVPLAALVHGWGSPQEPWTSVVERFELVRQMTSWDLLARIDPQIRDLPAPAEAAVTAAALRGWMSSQDEHVAPVSWLFSVTADDPEMSLNDLHEHAVEARRRAEGREQ